MDKRSAVSCAFLSEPKEDQIRQIVALYRTQGWWQPGDEGKEHLVRRLIAGSHCFLAALDQDDIVGMGRAISDGVSDAYIQDLTVRIDRRGEGIATQMLQKIIDRLHADGIAWIGLIAEPGSADLYHHAGFLKMSGATPMVLITKQ